ncbi:hypothetical protein BRADI_3g40741v3 [Brachypodium distachyon]|uniref:BTB domain-containing protein n=1 Tax=Brachypodium distachyon TaxID=15368 RepID=A0A2K2D2F6_BRADI|nr:hypothetical protein BRADI_3g40741v3 [Brachypodium distachyon]
MRTTIVDSSVVQLTIDYEQAKKLPIGKELRSDAFSVGGHLWRIDCYPHGDSEDDKGEYLSVYLTHMSNTTSVNVLSDIFLMDRDGKPSSEYAERFIQAYKVEDGGSYTFWGWPKFVQGTTLEKEYVAEGSITIVCAIMVINEHPIPVPPSDIGTHLGSLLDHTDGTDVAFIVDGETFHAHRAVLAACSPVFRAELFGSMAEATNALHHNCPELKDRCIGFFVGEENFRKVVFTEGYGSLLLKFPSVTAELRKRVGS